LGLMGFSGSLPCTLFIDIISLFINWANKDVCLLACLLFFFNFEFVAARNSLQPRPLDGFELKIRLNTRFRARMCLFWVASKI